MRQPSIQNIKKTDPRGHFAMYSSIILFITLFKKNLLKITKQRQIYLNPTDIRAEVWENMWERLINYHAFNKCDSVSTFAVKNTVKSSKICLTIWGQNWYNLSNLHLQDAETVVYCLYELEANVMSVDCVFPYLCSCVIHEPKNEDYAGTVNFLYHNFK